MPNLLVQSDDSFLADAEPSLLEASGPPAYNVSYLSTSAKSLSQKADIAAISESMKSPLKLIEVLNSIISIPDAVQHVIKGFRTVLCQQPHTKQVQIIKIIHTLSDVCDEVSKLDEDLSSSSKRSNRDYAEYIGGVRNDRLPEECKTSARSPHILHDQLSDSENLVANPKGPDSIPYSKTEKIGSLLNTGTKRKKSMSEDVIVLGTPITSSELSSPSRTNTPSGNHMDETPELLDCEQTVDQLLSQTIEEFAQESCEQVRLFTSAEDPVTYKIFYGLLRGIDDEEKAEWSSGIEWTSLVTKGYGTRQYRLQRAYLYAQQVFLDIAV
ncbi:uncharacterized protein TRIVIDRAFT_224546 [Trichoderma virens Gv29-8]|uniref:Uncharacterized protein n=1 Tax=Hypocrea virens (strain Gv29-8 / FGSC 10586) TaxID=413071 RepID=G9N0K8_HYPVG|nr:uncharacterized protein TRIVIDRAFT_224546 [Trichoderma virens Gv29-8]EHK19890.1 hypothetical protein TRIVIDRAFT_224546 [Trichoderma virens Gv29-8]